MAARISGDKVDQMVALLDSWPHDLKLSWSEFITECYRHLHFKYSRQALCRHWLIAEAFTRNKKRLRDASVPRKLNHLTVKKAAERIERLEQQVKELEHANQTLLEQFVRWAYNASNRGLTEEYLNQPLPHADRNPSILP